MREFLPNYTVRQMHWKMVKSDIISGGHIQPGPDMAGYENLAGFRPGLGPDMISSATLPSTNRARHRLTSLIETNALTTMPSRQLNSVVTFRLKVQHSSLYYADICDIARMGHSIPWVGQKGEDWCRSVWHCLQVSRSTHCCVMLSSFGTVVLDLAVGLMVSIKLCFFSFSA